MVHGTGYTRINIPFWRNAPKLWFTKLESEFEIYNIEDKKDDDLQCSILLRNLDQGAMQSIADIMELSQTECRYRYNVLKRALIKKDTELKRQQFRELCAEIEFRNQKPSELLKEMRLKMIDDIDDQYLQTLWIQKLPRQVQELLNIVGNMELDKLIAIADKVVDMDGSSVPAIKPIESPGNNIQRIQTDVNTMTSLAEQEERLCGRSNFRRRFIKGLKTVFVLVTIVLAQNRFSVFTLVLQKLIQYYNKKNRPYYLD